MQTFVVDPLFVQLVADALYRCSTQSVATRIIVKICSLSPSIMPSLSPRYLLSGTIASDSQICSAEFGMKYFVRVAFRTSVISFCAVANSGPGIKTSELCNFFPQFRKSCYSISSTQLGLRWGKANHFFPSHLPQIINFD